MTPAQRAALHALASKATPGPWVVDMDTFVRTDSSNQRNQDDLWLVANAAFIVASRPEHTVALLDALDGADGDADQLREALRDATNYLTDLVRLLEEGKPLPLEFVKKEAVRLTKVLASEQR